MPTFGNSDKVDLLTHYANVSMESCKAWTRVIGIHGTDDVQESNMWLKELLINSSTTTLHRKVCETHDALDVQEQGGVTYFKIMMETIVEMTEEVAKAADDDDASRAASSANGPSDSSDSCRAKMRKGSR